MKHCYFFAVPLLFLLPALSSQAQQKDSTQPRLLGGKLYTINTNDSIIKYHSPRKAAIRSALVPGWGQIYNRKYWKLPLVWGALGVTGAIFNYNLTEYKKIRFAYFALLNHDTPSYAKVAPELQTFINNNDLEDLRVNRNEFRKNIDYTVLFFIAFWGLNVVDATVDAHLMGFDVSREVTMHISPPTQPIPHGVGLSLVFSLKKPESKWANTTPGF